MESPASCLLKDTAGSAVLNGLFARRDPSCQYSRGVSQLVIENEKFSLNVPMCEFSEIRAKQC